MKKLTKMLLIHWHNYEKELLEFDTINFLTGKTAAGKSTIIDALQLVLLGDTGGSFFNKAANTRSARTLKGYLFGEKGDDGDTGFNYIRSDRFTSYIVLEFEDTEKQNKFLMGILSDCYKDQSYIHKFFVIRGQDIPEHCFIDEKTGIPYDLVQFRAFLKKWLKNSSAYDIPETNSRYRELTAGLLGQIKSKYRMLLKKAVPFTPISDIEQFITESICDVKNLVNIEQMQSDIRQYKKLERDAAILTERIEYLKEIETLSRRYEGRIENQRQQEYIILRSDLYLKETEGKKYREEIKDKELKIAAYTSDVELFTREKNQLSQERERLYEEYKTSDILKIERDLRQALEQCQKQINQLDSQIIESVKRLRHFGSIWAEIYLANNRFIETDDEADAFVQTINRLKKVTREEGCLLDITAISRQFRMIQDRLQKAAIQIEGENTAAKQTIDEMAETISNLQQGIKPYPGQILTLKRILNEKTGAEVSILSDLLEIKDERWRNAIEAYLDKQKFYLIIDEQYFQQALRIYQQVKEEYQIHDVGLVDIGKLKSKTRQNNHPDSLAEEVEALSEAARIYADYLLGGVVKCSHVDELRNHKISITEDCMLYKGYVARRLSPKRYANPYIGRASLALLLAAKRAELAGREQEYLKRLEDYKQIHRAAQTEILGEYEAAGREKAFAAQSELDGLRQLYKENKQEYDTLDLTYLKKLEKRIEILDKSIKEKEEAVKLLDRKRMILEVENDSIRNRSLLQVNEEIIKLITEKERLFEADWVERVGEKRFRLLVDEGRDMANLSQSYKNSLNQTRIAIKNLREERVQKRSDYNKEYKMSYDVNIESNQFFDKELKELSEIRLPDYLNKITDSKEKAYNQFRDDFIAKIKSNIETITLQLKELNTSLKQSVFGTDTYRFEKKPRPEYKRYYDMIMDPLLMDTGGYNIASESFNQKYQKEISDLFQQLIYNETEVSAERKVEYEKAIRKFTDYKTYLLFDLVVTNEKGEEQRLSKTLLKKSGGETQIPFYIAMLASFSQVCRVRTKNNNTIRVIILDEAFSKMDGERIKESIRLLRRFELQAIFSAPTDKIPDIAPLVDRNIAVFKDGQHSYTKYFDPKQIDEELMES